METTIWFLAALAIMSISVIVGAWRMINFKAAFTCFTLIFIAALYFVHPSEYLPLVTWVAKVAKSHWVLLVAFVAITAIFWKEYGTPSGFMTLVLLTTVFTAIISGQAYIVMMLALIAITAVAIAWGVSFVTPAQWAAASVWVRANKLLFAGCLTLIVLAVMLILWVTGASTFAKWVAFFVLVVAVVIFGQYAQARHGFYTEIHRVWTTEILPELALWATNTERFIRDASANHVGPFMWKIKFGIAALVPARIAYLAYHSHESWATKWVVILFIFGTLVFIGLQFPKAADVFFDLLGDGGAAVITKYKVFFNTLPKVYQFAIIVGTIMWSLWCAALYFIQHREGAGVVLAVWWLAVLPFLHFAHPLNKLFKKLWDKLIH